MPKYLITKEEIDQLEGVEKAHFLNSNAQRLNKSLGDLTGIKGFGFHIIEVPSGCVSTEHHKHYFEDECVYIIEGLGEAIIGEQTYPVKAGDFLGYPAGGEAHSIYNNSDSVLKCIVVGQRLDHDVGDYPNSNKRIYRQKGMPWNLVDIGSIVEPDAGKKN